MSCPKTFHSFTLTLLLTAIIVGALQFSPAPARADTLTCNCGGSLGTLYWTTTGIIKEIGCDYMCYYEKQLAEGAMTRDQINTELGMIYYCYINGDCELKHFMLTLVMWSNRLLGAVGAIALLAFVYGGFMFLISAGSTEQVAKAKKIIIGAVVGLFIVFASYMIINFISESLGATDDIFTSGWQT